MIPAKRFTGFWLSWARLMSAFARGSARFWPASARLLMAGTRFWPASARLVMAGMRAWRLGLLVLIGGPVVAGWPLLFWFTRTEPAYRGWLRGIAIPWWIVLGVTVLMLAACTPDEGPG